MSPLNPIVVIRNGFPADSLTGRQFIFNDLSWTVDSTDVVCVVNRPDLFYLPDRPLDVSINISGDQWTNVFRCPYPTDPFFFVCLSPGSLKVYPYNCSQRLLGATASIKVRIL
jgi:hypothetical protein